MNETYPFIIIRSYGSGELNDRYTRQVFEANRRYPGLVNEIWFSGGTLDGAAAIQREIEENLPYREECRAVGIRFSFQQGVTLNHGPDGIHREHLSDEAWAVDWNGNLVVGVLCPLSPEAREYTRRQVGEFMRHLQPASYWPDDDMRLYGKGEGCICFCDRCLEKFNHRYHHGFTRQELKRLLQTDESPEAASVRREWSLSNGENLSEYASVFADCRDEFAPDCLLGVQSVFASWVYDGPDYYPMLKALSGKRGCPVAIRPGAGHYEDLQPMNMVAKGLDMQQESARCRGYGFVGQICAEVENWPHVASVKNPYGLLAEASFMLACGVDSLALYWGSDANGEDEAVNEFFFEALNRYKPFMLKIQKCFQHTRATGLALYRGGNAYAQPEWAERRHPMESKLAANGVPVVRMESRPEAYVLDERCVRELSEEDLPKVLSTVVLMDVESYEALGKKFTQLECAHLVERVEGAKASACTAERLICEEYGDHQWAFNMSCPLKPLNNTVQVLSTVTGFPGTCGSCLIPTGQGGYILLIQSLALDIPWTGPRRRSILDALDSHIPGGLSVRLLTSGFRVVVIARCNDAGECVGCYLMNMGSGQTMGLELAIRRPASQTFAIACPADDAHGNGPDVITPCRRTGDEVVIRLPPLMAMQPMLLTAVPLL